MVGVQLHALRKKSPAETAAYRRIAKMKAALRKSCDTYPRLGKEGDALRASQPLSWQQPEVAVVPMTSGIAPNLTIDVDEKFAWMQWVAALVWGGDSRKQNHALATFAAELIATLRDVPNQHPLPGDLCGLANKMGISPAEIARMPGSREFFSSYFSERGANDI
jgi:hypothetical protein